MSENDIKWTQNQLFNVLPDGMSDKVLAEYFVENAKTAKSKKDLIMRIQNSGMAEMDAQMINFCNNLFARVGPEEKQEKMSRLLEDTLKMKNKRYDLVSDDDDEYVSKKSKKSSKKDKKSKKERNLRKRRASNDDEDDVINYESWRG